MWQPILRCRGLALCIIFAVVAVTMLVPGTAISRVDVTLEVKREMKFGEFAADISGGGTVVLSAFADTVTQSGPITNFGGTVTRARVQINGQNRAYVIVSLPSSITIRKGTSSNYLTVNNFTMDQTNPIRLNNQGVAIINIGATLNITTNQKFGNYNDENEFTFTVEYL
jgi:hypothetical protein